LVNILKNTVRYSILIQKNPSKTESLDSKLNFSWYEIYSSLITQWNEEREEISSEILYGVAGEYIERWNVTKISTRAFVFFCFLLRSSSVVGLLFASWIKVFIVHF
jgi:hypothetical protein